MLVQMCAEVGQDVMDCAVTASSVTFPDNRTANQSRASSRVYMPNTKRANPIFFKDIKLIASQLKTKECHLLSLLLKLGNC